MRILGVSQKWDKLKRPKFTTFRFTRRDKDWGVEEVVQVVFKPRSKEREILGIAEIIEKVQRDPLPKDVRNNQYVGEVTDAEAKEDGFHNYNDMWLWLCETHSLSRLRREPMNKLTLKWR